MQHAGWRLDDIFGCLTCAGETVVSCHGEVFVAGGTVLQLEDLARDHSMLLRHAAWRANQRMDTTIRGTVTEIARIEIDGVLYLY